MNIRIRPEQPGDEAGVRAVTAAAFRDVAHSSGTEAAIVDALRAAGALTISLIAMMRDEMVGHIAFSPVRIGDEAGHWFGLGPVSVLPARQRQGVGTALIRDGLGRLRATGAAGCVLLGNPGYYGRFGFGGDPALTYGGAPSPYLQWLGFGDARPRGAVVYHPGFDAR